MGESKSTASLLPHTHTHIHTHTTSVSLNLSPSSLTPPLCRIHTTSLSCHLLPLSLTASLVDFDELVKKEQIKKMREKDRTGTVDDTAMLLALEKARQRRNQKQKEQDELEAKGPPKKRYDHMGNEIDGKFTKVCHPLLYTTPKSCASSLTTTPPTTAFPLSTDNRIKSYSGGAALCSSG
ncbi:hypothetical protein BJ741DRAFT_273011 [Chytriomyces cf. hyalinus JEL632]|nr:hypothetical protein BJ741DRAFT_273011 [Chytriomyces cf. hyalinus JEL632]